MPDELIRFLKKSATIENEQLNVLLGDAVGRDHLRLISRSLDFLNALAGVQNSEVRKQFALKLIAVRLFNDLAAATKLVAAGYYQVALNPIRDVLEICNLLRLFAEDESHVLKWLNTSEENLINTYGPGQVRKMLAEFDRRDGIGEWRRRDVYKMFSKYGTHFSVESMRVLVDGERIVSGPYRSPKACKAVLHESAKWGHLGTSILIAFFPEASFDPIQLNEFFETGRSWMKKYA